MRVLTIVIAAVVAAPVLAQPATQGAGAPGAPAAKPVTTMLKSDAADRGDGTQPRQRFVTVFGTDPCPKPTSSDEVVICARLKEDPARIPEALRHSNDSRVSAYESNRDLLLGDASGGAGGGIGSCSVNGPGGYIGCNRKQAEAWAADRTARMGHDEVVPPQ